MAFPIPAAFVYCLLAGTLVLTDGDIVLTIDIVVVFVVFSNEDDDDDGGGEDAS